MSRSEIVNAILKGIGIRPTSLLLRWNPTFKNPFRFDLLEVSKCNVDGEIVTLTMAPSLRPLHAGHRIGSPKCYSLWEFLKVQFRMIR